MWDSTKSKIEHWFYHISPFNGVIHEDLIVYELFVIKMFVDFFNILIK